MIERAYIHVSGPAGGGKTTFVEAMLTSTDALVLVARCMRDDSLARPTERAPKAHPELRRYQQAGADSAVQYAFPGRQDSTDAFFMTDLMMDYSEAVVIEGDCPLSFVDLRVFVAPSPARTQRLFVRRSRRPSPGSAAVLAALQQPSPPDDLLAAVLGRIGGEPLAELVRNDPTLSEKMRGVLGEVASELANRPAPGRTEKRWAVADAYAGIEDAGLVIVDTCPGGNPRAAEALVADVVRMRKDKELAADILGPRGNRVPVTALVADLADPDDLGRRKAIARVRRAIRSRSS